MEDEEAGLVSSANEKRRESRTPSLRPMLALTALFLGLVITYNSLAFLGVSPGWSDSPDVVDGSRISIQTELRKTPAPVVVSLPSPSSTTTTTASPTTATVTPSSPSTLYVDASVYAPLPWLVHSTLAPDEDRMIVRYTIEETRSDERTSCFEFNSNVKTFGAYFWKSGDEDNAVFVEGSRVGCYTWVKSERDVLAGTGGMGYQHVIDVLSPPLEAGTVKYEYVVGQPKREGGDFVAQTREYSFNSRPSSDQKLRIFFVGDVDVSQKPRGDASAPKVFEALASSDRLKSTHLMVHLGDASYASNRGGCGSATETDSCSASCNPTKIVCKGNSRQTADHRPTWLNWERRALSTWSHLPIVTVMGNHDNDLTWFLNFRPPVRASHQGVPSVTDDDLRTRLIELRDADAKVAQGLISTEMRKPYYYAFARGDVLFVAIGTEDNPFNAYESRGPLDSLTEENEKRFADHYGTKSNQYVWLEKTLRGVDRTITPFVVVYTHRPLYHENRHHRMNSPQGDWYGMRIQELYSPLFEKYKVSLILSGHSHHYMRTKPAKMGAEPNTLFTSDDLTDPVYVICGTGGYRIVDGFVGEYDATAFRQSTTFGYCTLDVISRSVLKIRHVSDDDVELDSATILGPGPDFKQPFE